MFCILVTGIPAAGKSTMAEFLAKRLNLPLISKDQIVVDTTDFSKADYEAILKQIERYL